MANLTRLTFIAVALSFVIWPVLSIENYIQLTTGDFIGLVSAYFLALVALFEGWNFLSNQDFQFSDEFTGKN